MDNFIDNSTTINITNGIIETIESSQQNTLITVSYTELIDSRPANQSIRLVVNSNTFIVDERGSEITPRDLQTGMTINAIVSSAMTRSIPPQTNAFVIHVIRRAVRPTPPSPERPNPGRPIPSETTTGRILNIDRQNRSFTTISDGNLSSIIKFNVPQNTVILGRNGTPINFSMLVPGLEVRIRHASFMTASIPPQTTAFEVRVL